MTANPDSMNIAKTHSEFSSGDNAETNHADRLLDVEIIVHDKRWGEIEGLGGESLENFLFFRRFHGLEYEFLLHARLRLVQWESTFHTSLRPLSKR